MLKLILFLLSHSVFCDKISDQILNVMIDKSVHPCDDFYRHVCGVNAKEDLMTPIHEMEKIEFLNSTVFDDVSEYLVEVIQCTNEPYNTEIISEKLRADFNIACQNGQQQIFLENFGEFFNITINATNFSCQENQEYVDSVFGKINSLFVEEYKKKCRSLLQYRHFTLWLYRNQKAVNRMKNLFELTKKSSYELIDKTPWINNRNLNKNYEHFLNITYLHTSERFFDDMKNVTTDYSVCKKSVSQWLKNSEIIKKMCVRETFKINQDISQKPVWSPHELPKHGARNKLDVESGHLLLRFSSSFFFLASHIKSEALFFGLNGLTMAHEMGHSMILYREEELYFTKNGTTCVQNQIKKSCAYFNEEECEKNKTLIKEEGADMIGAQISLDLVKMLMGPRFYDISNENENITNNQLYFYGQAASLCLKSINKTSNLFYSPNQVRFNLIAAQSSEFQKAFQCAPDSKMMRSAAEKCYLFGEDAPLY